MKSAFCPYYIYIGIFIFILKDLCVLIFYPVTIVCYLLTVINLKKQQQGITSYSLNISLVMSNLNAKTFSPVTILWLMYYMAQCYNTQYLSVVP